MSNPGSLESAARTLLDQEWKQAELAPRGGTGLVEVAEDRCPMSWVVPELLRLLAESHDRPAARLRSAIRQLLVEQDIAYECGDPVIGDDHVSDLEAHVSMMVRALERVRRHARARGEWSDAPIAPQMFG